LTKNITDIKSVFTLDVIIFKVYNTLMMIIIVMIRCMELSLHIINAIKNNIRKEEKS